MVMAVGIILVYTFLKPGQGKHVILLIIAGHTRDDGWLLLSYSLNSIVGLQDVSVSSSSH